MLPGNATAHELLYHGAAPRHPFPPRHIRSACQGDTRSIAPRSQYRQTLKRRAGTVDPLLNNRGGGNRETATAILICKPPTTARVMTLIIPLPRSTPNAGTAPAPAQPTPLKATPSATSPILNTTRASKKSSPRLPSSHPSSKHSSMASPISSSRTRRRWTGRARTRRS